MKQFQLVSCLLGWALVALLPMEAQARQASSPNGMISVSPQGEGYVVQYGERQVLHLPAVGYDAAVAAGLEFDGRVVVDYNMLAGKRLHCYNVANEYHAEIAKGQRMVVRLFDDGVAFRYELTGASVKERKEKTAFLIPEGTKRWMMQWNDAYEGFFPLATTSKVPAVRGADRAAVSQEGYNRRWAFPALLQLNDDVFALLTEANIETGQSAACLYSDGERYTVTPDGYEATGERQWHSPWRVVIMGDLKTVVESTLVTDVSEPSKLKDAGWVKPGVVSWVYWAYNHGSKDFQIVKNYIDMAKTLKLPYVLIDAEWDQMGDGHNIEEAVKYAISQGVKPMIWYNSSVGWIDGAPGPKFRLNKPEDREKEFEWCEKLGVAGVKIDFFSGDNQKNMDYCIQLLECAARHHLLINFHGATIPRGWQRTWPNLLSTEAVYGAEWYNNVPTFTDKAAAHNATLPFTRNVIGPMDYTPCAFSDSQHPHITTRAHELALTVLYESGLQHLADKPESFLQQPKEVQDFLGSLPAAWDETRFVAGYPGEFAVMARRCGNTWYVAGINGTDSVKNIPLPLKNIFEEKRFKMAFLDGTRNRKGDWDIQPIGGVLPDRVICQPRGGFLYIVEQDVHNPMLWADVPDPDVIRVGDTFYLVTTTMHLMPGAPIMKSKDLKNWETVGYIFDKLTDSPKYDLQQGTVYGRGQWATSLKYHNGKFYALLAPNEQGAMGDTYIFTADKAEGPWTVLSRMRHFHDCSLFFDDDGRVYVVYGTGELMELKPDLSDVIEGTHRKIFQREPDEMGLLEGSRMLKHNGKYYLLMISHTYSPGRNRREVCYRADNILGPYEKKVILESDFGGFSYEAQGTIVDTQDGDWYGIIFQDRGGVGRVLTLMPCRWIDGWPMLGDENGKVTNTVRPLVSGQPKNGIVKSDDFNDSQLGLHWQWNHNPVDKAWSLTEKPGCLRLKTNRVVDNLYLATNTITQRMEGPACSGDACIDFSHLKDGDCAGLAAFNGDSGVLTIKKKGKKCVLELSEQHVQLSGQDKKVESVEEKVLETVDLGQNSQVWLKVEGDFRPGNHPRHDMALFYYSTDGSQWKRIGPEMRMIFDYRRFFMGTKFAIFCYATKKAGGYIDVDEFRYNVMDQTHE